MAQSASGIVTGVPCPKPTACRRSSFGLLFCFFGVNRLLCSTREITCCRKYGPTASRRLGKGAALIRFPSRSRRSGVMPREDLLVLVPSQSIPSQSVRSRPTVSIPTLALAINPVPISPLQFGRIPLPGGTGGSSASVFVPRKTHWRASRQCHPRQISPVARTLSGCDG